MKIRPVLKQLSVIPMTIALGSVLLPGCDRKLGGDVPMTPELQEQWQSEEQNQERALPKQDFWANRYRVSRWCLRPLP